jgi:hypothetical protein
MRKLGSASLFALMVIGACSHFQPASHPLYAGPPRPTAEVAGLSGPVATVDGVDVSSVGSSFTLLPGCHVVGLRRRIGEGNVNGAWSTELRYAIYAFRMTAGSSYEIDVHLQPGNAGVGNANVGGAQVEAVERNPAGKVIGVIAPVHKPAEVEACRDWEANQAKPAAPEAAVSADAGAPPVAPKAGPDAGAGVASDGGTDDR